jgi:hypothetical protein
MFSSRCFEVSGKTVIATVQSGVNEAVAVFAVLCLLCWPSCQAQVKAGSKNPQGTVSGNQQLGTLAQFHDRLRTTFIGPGTTSPKIANPQASKFEDSAIIVVCRNQKQTADREAQETAGNNTRVLKGPGGSAPQQPMVSRSASGGRPGSVPNSTVAPSLPSSSAGSAHSMFCTQPIISTISGLPTVVFFPGPLFNPYTIKGCGFGNQPGSVYLSGPFNGGRVNLQVQSFPGSQKQQARPAVWSDTMIVVNVDPQVWGEVDQDNVTLVVQPAMGPAIQKSGNKFLAAREEVILQTIPQGAVKFLGASSISKNSSSTSTLALTSPDLLYYTPPKLRAGISAEVFRGGTTAFFPAGSDHFDFSGLYRGFQTESYQLSHENDPTGCDGKSAGSLGTWGGFWEGPGGHDVRVDWKEFRCHLSWMGDGPDVWSDYALTVWVSGPRGIDPWTGKQTMTVLKP